MRFAKLIVQGTEQVAARTGATIGGLLNATFGNLPELTIAMKALRAGLLEMVRASIVGALLTNLLVALGLPFLLGGVRHHSREYNPDAGRTCSSTMVLAWIALALPSAFHRAVGLDPYQAEHATLDLVVSILLLGLYGLFLLCSLNTHPETFAELNAPASHGGAAETGSAIAMGRTNHVDLSIGIAMGRCVQAALFLAPVLVSVAPAVGQGQFQLVFSQVEM
jgi:Ca2+:H+ antiporter